MFLFCQQFVSLLNPAISVDIEILRDCYESFAMYCFGRYLVACLGMTSFALPFAFFLFAPMCLFSLASTILVLFHFYKLHHLSHIVIKYNEFN